MCLKIGPKFSHHNNQGISGLLYRRVFSFGISMDVGTKYIGRCCVLSSRTKVALTALLVTIKYKSNESLVAGRVKQVDSPNTA
jgi:hypothetical protein